jgi:hypothetical protein
MGTFNSSKTIITGITSFDRIEAAFRQHFENKEFVVVISKNSNGFFASLTNGGIFKAVLGMKSSLNVEVKQVYNGVSIEAKVGIFGQQIVPSVISMFVFWPVLLTQIAGLVAQSKLDDEAIRVIEDAIHAVEVDK